MMEVKVLFIDNFDSFTYNLVDEFAKRDCPTKVYRADTPLERLKQVFDEFAPDLLVLSPGPGNPDTAGITLKAIDYFKDKLPIFGVCLGHQSYVHANCPPAWRKQRNLKALSWESSIMNFLSMVSSSIRKAF
jgi:anthranilate synthase component 2